MQFVDLIIPLAVPNFYTYFVPEEYDDAVMVGKRVVVKFGRSKLYTAIIRRVHNKPPTEYQAKGIEFVLDENPIVLPQQLEFWDWMCEYYMCFPGEVMNAALPSGFKLVSETKILLNPDHDLNFEDLDDREYLIAEALQLQTLLSIDDISKILGLKSVHGIIKSLIEKDVILLEEELNEKYREKREVVVRLNTEEYPTSESLQQAFELVKNASKQEDLLMQFVSLPKFNFEDFKIKRSRLIKETDSTNAALNGLVKKGIFELNERVVGRLQKYEGELQQSSELNEEQVVAYDSVKKHFEDKTTVLLHGVTGSGKTEVYIRLIEDAIQEGKQVLYLLPEIALTTQIVTRLQKVFGDKVGVFHSKFNLNERVEVWNDLIKPSGNKFQVILGARSAVFLPFQNLGLIIVDEEHENTFKQYDPAPRYQGRDAAIYLAHKLKSKCLLGTATPAVESYFNAINGKYGLVEMNKRFGGIQMPEIQCADLKNDHKKRKMISMFSPLLKKEMDEALENGEQIILFQNRRGFAPVLECYVCGNTQKCKRCDVSLTYHKHSNILRCHYCGYSEDVPTNCVACGSVETGLKGFGTEKIEEEVQNVFPTAKVARMDLDTTRSKNAYSNILADFEDKEIDILVGTQMITKGLDFDNVSLVGILNADQMLNYPDFRAFERAYQLMSQVSGRSGRKRKRGKVIIQTFNPFHTTIRNVMDSDYLAMYNEEVLNRRNFKYPPFYRLIQLTLKHKNANVLDACSDAYASNIRQEIGGERVLGPEYPSIKRINNFYHKQILVKVEKELSITFVKNSIQNWIDKFKKDPAFKSVRIIVDVDPQ